MNVKRRISYITIIIIAIVLLLIIIPKIMKAYKQRNDGSDTELRKEAIEAYEKTKGKIQEVSSLTEYEMARLCLQKFYYYYAEIFDDSLKEYGEDYEFNLEYYQNKILGFLLPKYIESHELDSSNVSEKMPRVTQSVVEIYDMYKLTQYNNIDIYFVGGLLRNIDDNSSQKFEIVLYYDTHSKCFQVSLDNPTEKSIKELKVGEQYDVEFPTGIKYTEDNKLESVQSSYEEFAKREFGNIRKLMLYDTELAYDYLYNNNTFATVNELSDFITNNKRDIVLLTYKDYDYNYIEKAMCIDMYDSSNKYMITIYLNNFSKLSYLIEKIG